MWLKSTIIFIFLSFITSGLAFAQKTTPKRDSTNLYENIQSFSVRSKFTKFMYRLIFRPVAIGSSKKLIKRKVYKKLIQKPNSAFEGKIIRHIHIETLDPFGYSIADTVVASLNVLTRAGNKLHVKSLGITIRNLLLIRENQKYDSLLVKESERLVRRQGYVQDVAFYTVASANKSDSVDVYIRELDKWSIIPRFAASSSRMTINLMDRNFSGLGHEFTNAFTWNHSTGKAAFNTNYYIPNIRNTYVSSTLHYGTDEYGNFVRNFAVERPFFSPFAKWAAGVIYAQQFRNDSIHTSGLPAFQQRIKFNTQDYWVGNAMQIFKGNTENIRTTNFVSTLRYLRIRYLEKPAEKYDSLHYFASEDFYLGSNGISTRKYVQDKYIFNFGITEDVPIGKVYNFTYGYQEKNNKGRLYLGARVSTGNYYQWGYISSSYEYGTFFRDSHPEQGVFSAGVIYFTGLVEIGKWKFRQFVKPQLTIGINRFSADSLTLKDGYGLDGFNSSGLTGTSRLLFTLQTQAYTPWNFIGFRFGPYFIYTLGMLGDEATGFKKSKVYSQIGLGVLIKNINLVINTFQISIAFYPSIPGNGQNVFKVNSFNAGDFGFRDFEIGKPAALVFE